MKKSLVSLLSLSLCSSVVFAEAEAVAPAAPAVAQEIVAPVAVNPVQAEQNARFAAIQQQREARIKQIEAQRAEFNKTSKEYSDKMRAAKTAEEMQAIADEHRKAMDEKTGMTMPERPQMPDNSAFNQERAAHMAKMKALYDIQDPAERQKQLMAYQAEQRQQMRGRSHAMPQNMPMHPAMNGNVDPRFGGQQQMMQQQRAEQQKMMQQQHQKMEQDMMQRMANMEKMMQQMQQNRGVMPAPVAPTPAPVAPAPAPSPAQ